MLSTILVSYPWLTTAAFLSLALLGPVLGSRLVSRPRVTTALLVLAGAAVVLLTLMPTSRVLDVGCAVEWSLPQLGAVEHMANIILFVPVVLLAGVLTGRPLLAFVAASGLSILIEAVQAFVPVLGRSCSTNDWLANTLGALLGAVLAVVALRRARASRGSTTVEDPVAGR